MDDLILTDVFDDGKMEILPPEPKTRASGLSSCDLRGVPISVNKAQAQ
jgi:hypothetical protein